MIVRSAASDPEPQTAVFEIRSDSTPEAIVFANSTYIRHALRV